MSAPTERTDIKIQRERAVLAAVHLPESRFDPRDPLGELRALAETAGTRVVGEITQNRDRPEAGTYMGKGKIEELKGMCDELNAGVVIFDHELSPKQIAAIEEIVGRKVLDRSELILDIFASRATTKQARLQVEIAQLEYTYPRLRAMWDHLERIVGSGGIGGVGTRGPGEQQLEIDRRIVQRRKSMLKKELEEVQARKTREVRSRNASHFTVGLVGYTNAGKSTLFNVLTEGGAYANDQLFATLLTRTREWRLSAGDARGMEVMLSDTVGFIRSLPHHLVGSFRATLEEATHADLLLLVLDVSDPNADLAYETVTETLNEIFEDTRRIEQRAGFEWSPPETLLLLNKVDLLRDNASLLVWERRDPDAIAISAARPDEPWRAELEARVREAARGKVEEWDVTLPMSDGKAVHNAEQWGEVLDRTYDNGSVTLRARLGERDVARLRALSRDVRAERIARNGSV